MTDTDRPGEILSPRNILVRMFQGAVIGAGAILPGISGGVLCVAFGIYQPMMAMLSHPIRNFLRYWKLLIPVGVGWALGFVLLAGVIANFLEQDAAAVTSLFIGLILGTFPSLFGESARFGRTKPMWAALALSTSALWAFFHLVKSGTQTALIPSFGWYVFCGVLWGISLIVPGMSSSSLLLLFGLYQPLSEGVSQLDPVVLFPFAIGIAATVLLLARLVSRLFEKHYGIAFHCVIGFVIASTIPIIPTSFSGAGEALLCVGTAAVGFAASFFMNRWSKKHPAEAAEQQAAQAAPAPQESAE